MTRFERLYRALHLLMPVHYVKVRRLLSALCNGRNPVQLLDIGGRESDYTIGLQCQVHIVELPQESDVQIKMGLGLNEEKLNRIRPRRSNIASIFFEDITRSALPDASYDGAVSVECIEHVPDDSAFVRQIHRILKPGGFLVLTTPNGETKPVITNPDHLRHYKRAELEAKLKEAFEDVRVFYGVRLGYLHRASLKRWISRLRDPRRFWTAPWYMVCVLLANLLEGDSSRDANQTNHLFAVAKKAP